MGKGNPSYPRIDPPYPESGYVKVLLNLTLSVKPGTKGMILRRLFRLTRVLKKQSPRPAKSSKNFRDGNVTKRDKQAALQHRSTARVQARKGIIAGKAYVRDGDSLSVSGREVRIAGVDAPEWDQVAKHQSGNWYRFGGRVKKALIREIGGRDVHVQVELYDRFDRATGTVTCNGKDVGAWLVSEGYAIAAYSDRYKHLELKARQAKRGMWSHSVNIDPRAWRHRNRK